MATQKEHAIVVKKRILRSIATVLVLAGALSLPGMAHAQVIRVNSLDGGSVPGACTITDAVAAANAGSSVNGCSTNQVGGFIGFDVSGTVTLNMPLFISSFISINATGQNVTLSGGGVTHIFGVTSGATLELVRVTVANGAGFEAGGIENFGLLVSRQSTFTANHGSVNGAISNEGILIVSDSAFYGNSASLFPFAGAIRNAGQAQIVNSTISGNFAFAGIGGERNGGIGNTATGELTLVNTTLSGNGGLVGGLGNAGTLFLANTLLAGNAGPECSSTGSITVYSVNLIGDGSCSVPGALSGDARLGPLADNGGDTLTHALLEGSPAIDAGDNTMCALAPASNHDQRGQPRPYDGDNDGIAVCDIGSFERGLVFPFSGFLAPVDPLPTVNAVKAGRAIPVKFSLDGYRGINIFADGSPASQQVTCDAQSPVSDVEQTVTAGGSSLTYDATSDIYTYVWKTSGSWAGTCRQLVLRLSDGSRYVASFRFK
jgi:hypothetical protein